MALSKIEKLESEIEKARAAEDLEAVTKLEEKLAKLREETVEEGVVLEVFQKDQQGNEKHVRFYDASQSDSEGTPNGKTYIEKAEGFAKKIGGEVRKAKAK